MTNLIDEKIKNEISSTLKEIFTLYDQFEQINLAASNYYMPLTILKCNCNLQKTRSFGYLVGDAGMPSKQTLVYPPLVAYCAYHVHYCVEQNKFI